MVALFPGLGLQQILEAGKLNGVLALPPMISLIDSSTQAPINPFIPKKASLGALVVPEGGTAEKKNGFILPKRC